MCNRRVPARSQSEKEPTDQELDRLAFRFFKLFARFEFTMKERGYFRTGQNGAIHAEWDRFANEVVGANFHSDLGEDGDAADYILDCPPMKQVVRSGRVVWVEVSNEDRSVQALFAHVRRMRNNLFHGAKFNETWFDPRRNRDLLRCGLRILQRYQEWLSQ